MAGKCAGVNAGDVLSCVVPAKAGTHNHKWLLVRDVGTTSPNHDIRRGVWVPAFAVTTCGKS